MNDVNVGARLKEAREKRGLSLRELSRRSGVALSFLSALEKNTNSVSVATLKNILGVLEVGLGEFFSAGTVSSARVLWRKAEMTEISGGGKGLSFLEVAAGRPGRALQLMIEHYEPAADTGPELYRHNAEEAGLVLKGKLELTVDGEVHVLGPGDGYYFDSRRPHRVRNVGKGPAEAVSVNTPPSF